MSNITFNNTSLNLVEDSTHEFLLSNKEVAIGYGTTIQSLAQAKRNNQDELIENKHWIRLEVQTKGGKQQVIHWTKKGIVRLGFFIKSEHAKKFRDWAEDYIVHKQQPSPPNMPDPYTHQLERENIELKRAINRLLQAPTNDNHLKKLEYENRDLKRILVGVHNRYHNILTTCSPLAMQDELKKMTNLFQFVASDEAEKNLNTKTIARHGYWS